MSKQEQNSNLWQQKRSELNVDTDMQGDWMDMHQLLDQQMPIINPPGADASNMAGNAKLGAKLAQIAKLKLFYVAAALIGTAALTYVVVKNFTSPKNNKPAKTEVRRDSLSNVNSQLSDQSLNDTLSIDGTKDNPAGNNNAVNDNIDNKNQPEDKATANGSTDNASGNNNAGVVNDQLSTNKVSAKKPDNITSGKPNGSSRLLASSSKTNNGLALTPNTPGGLSRSRGAENNRATSANGISRSGSDKTSSQKTNQPAINNNNTGSSSANNVYPNTIITQPLSPSAASFNGDNNLLINNYTSVAALFNKAAKTGNSRSVLGIKDKKQEKVKAPKTAGTGGGRLDLDWGIFTGVSLPGSFAPKAQNNNFYGSLPIDLYTGLFVTNNINDKWAIDAQIKLLIPNKANESYDHTYTTKNDTGGIVHNTLKITETRKIYSAQIPVHMVYNISPSVSIKAGPVINIPLKYYRLSSITPTSAFQDTAGYVGKLMDTLNSVKYENKISFGVSSGLSYTYKRLRLEATYYYSPQPIKVTSPLSTYSKNGNNLQISIGFKLNKPKP